MALIRRFVGNSLEVPNPVCLRRSQWFTNPYVRGSYSCRMVESNTLDVWPNHLAQPVKNKLGRDVSLKCTFPFLSVGKETESKLKCYL